MGRERHVVDAVILEGRSRREVARAAGISKAWVDALVARYKAGGHEALVPRSRRPHSCSHAAGEELQAAVVATRHQLADAGHDCGPHTIHYHLSKTRQDVPSVATIWRILKRRGLVTPQPQKRPTGSLIRFEAALPNEMWQSDTTHWQLADGTDIEILNYIDDHSRFLLACTAFAAVKGHDVVTTFHEAATAHGFPASLLTDNGAVYSGKSRRGKVFLESELERLGILFKHSTPYHPQTCGKVERFHQTLKRWLRKQIPAASITELQAQLDSFRAYYNHVRPHRALQRVPPADVFTTRLKATPRGTAPEAHFRVRHDRVDPYGRLTIRYLSRLHHIGIGVEHAGTRVHMLVANKHIRVIGDDGSLIRELILDPTRDYQPTGTRPGRRPIGHHVARHVASMS